MSTEEHEYEHDEASSPDESRPGAAPLPRIEQDETIAPRPEEEIADVARSEPDPDDRATR